MTKSQYWVTDKQTDRSLFSLLCRVWN